MSGTNNVSSLFSNFYILILLTLPLYTMRLLSEEKKARTDQGLLTAPVTLSEVVWGKYLAAYTLYFLGILVTVVYGILLAALSEPRYRIFLGNFLGILLLGAALVAIGLFISSLTESQMLAAIGTFAVMMCIICIDSISSIMPSGLSTAADLVVKLSFSARYYNFTSGMIKIPDVLFFVSVMLFFNFLTVQSLDRGRWVNSRKIRSASAAGGMTAGVLAVLILVNVICSLVCERVPALDLTENKIYDLSDDSRQILNALDENVRVIICYD